MDWTGNKRSAYAALGASNHTDYDREPHDFYATHPKAAELLLEVEGCNLSHHIWECACGQGHLSKVFESRGYDVLSTDLIYRGYGEKQPFDFLQDTRKFDGDIVTNPPYKYALEFCQRALDIVDEDRLVCMFLKLQFLEGKKRKQFFLDNPPRTVYVSSSRLACAMNGCFNPKNELSSSIAYCWYIWQKGYHGDTILKWFN